MDDERGRADMPEHEQDTDRTIGGGLLQEGGTAIDRGTGELDDDDAQAADDELADGADVPGPLDHGVVAGPLTGVAPPFVPLVDDDAAGLADDGMEDDRIHD